ncbi:MAG: DUF2334 domain-containing protein [Oligoflexia bacterium]|nr:DUF2334 domain-containing protein [Oligoflexia bacterium]MBF0366343.1 DUF2334 domain-containing protein [Oligoflexia bacterium]
MRNIKKNILIAAVVTIVAIRVSAALILNPVFASSPSQAPKISAGVKEIYITSQSYTFGSDGMARVLQSLSDVGITSITAEIRLAMNGANESEVYHPPYRSQKIDIINMISHLIHNHSDLVLKPVIFERPGKGVTNRLLAVNPRNVARWFSHYKNVYTLYAAIAAEREVRELVLGVGLTNIWRVDNADLWLNFMEKVARDTKGKTKLSIELTSSRDLDSLREWKIRAPAKWRQLLSLLNLVRVVPSGFPERVSTWRAEALAEQITASLQSVDELFDGKMPLSIASMTVPACDHIAYHEEQVNCLDLHDNNAFNYDVQKNALEALSASLSLIPSPLIDRVQELELNSSNTDPEPLDRERDFRLLLPNPAFQQMLKNFFLPYLTKNPFYDWKSVKNFHYSADDDNVVVDSQKWQACLYYDEEDEKDLIGAIHVRMLANLIGGFPKWQAVWKKLHKYVSGDLFRCQTAFYIGTNYTAKVPDSFLHDSAIYSQTHHLTWMNYKIWDYLEHYKAMMSSNASTAITTTTPPLSPLGFEYVKIDQPLTTPSETNEDPGFFRYFDYKGESFFKLAMWSKESKRFASSPELVEVKLASGIDPLKLQVLSWARHSKLADRTIPYVIRQFNQAGGSLFYFADSPFSYSHYEDRYMIFTDILWDILKEEAPKGPKMALVRLEDISVISEKKYVLWAIDYLAARKIPFSLAVIPFYSNVFPSRFSYSPVWKPISDYPDSIGILQYAKARNADFVFHGVAHQAGNYIGGYMGITGSDFEFWMFPENVPLPNDSTDFILDLLEKGEHIFHKLGIKPVAWENPHYACSVLDSILFGKVFEWNYHRSLYFKTHIQQEGALQPRHRMFECLSEECRSDRRARAREIKVESDISEFGGQIFPYTIYKDIYGQSIIPETLGFIDYTAYRADTWRPVSNHLDILRRAKKLKVIRGAVASFFWHPSVLNGNGLYYLDSPGSYEAMNNGKKTLTEIIEGLQKMGYVFASISDCKLFPRSNCI